MADDPTEDIIKREIAKARDIIREDRIMAKLGKHFPDEPEGKDGKDGPTPPDKKEEPGKSGEKAARRSIWWGDAVSDE